MRAPLHPGERARIAALRGYNILDTPREREFDDVVELAGRICGTTVSVINLIDAGRQWFKAETGLGVRETPLDTSLCAHVILAGDYVEIPDTLADARFSDNPLCLAEGGFRFYAGAVLRTGDGHPIGTLCVLDDRPRELDALQRDTLRLLAVQVMRQLDLRAALAREELLRREIDHRVKNSLQSVGAFVRLQRRNAGDAIPLLTAIERQIASVAILHAMISEIDGDWLDLGDYLDRLTQQLAVIAPDDITVAGRFDPLSGPAATASALGTIVNELAANALKHSFVDGVRGRITFTGTATDGGYTVTCSDDGSKAPVAAPADAPARVGLGLRVMKAAIRNLDGTLGGGPVAGGYRSVLAFPLPSR